MTTIQQETDPNSNNNNDNDDDFVFTALISIFFYISQTYLLFRHKKSIDRWIIRIERHVFDGVTICIFLPYICLVFAPSQ